MLKRKMWFTQHECVLRNYFCNFFDSLFAAIALVFRKFNCRLIERKEAVNRRRFTHGRGLESCALLVGLS